MLKPCVHFERLCNLDHTRHVLTAVGQVGAEGGECCAGTSWADLAGWGDLLQSRGATEEKRQAPGHTGDGEAKFRGFLAPGGRYAPLINFYHYTFCLSL